MIPTDHPILDEARFAADLAADAIALAAARLTSGRGSLSELLAAVDAFRVADRELAQLDALRVTVNGRAYTLRPSTRRRTNVRGEA